MEIHTAKHERYVKVDLEFQLLKIIMLESYLRGGNLYAAEVNEEITFRVLKPGRARTTLRAG